LARGNISSRSIFVEPENTFNYNEFVDQGLKNNGLAIKRISEDYMRTRLGDIMSFVNGVILEYGEAYGWVPQMEDYFMNPMNRKFDFSYMIERINSNEIVLFNLHSVYGDALHNHCTYANKKFRGMGLAKLHMVKICQAALENGFRKMEGYWPKRNSGSIILHLKMGWLIERMDERNKLFLIGDAELIRERTRNLYMAALPGVSEV
jgi:hypothetical protein